MDTQVTSSRCLPSPTSAHHTGTYIPPTILFLRIKKTDPEFQAEDTIRSDDSEALGLSPT